MSQPTSMETVSDPGSSASMPEKSLLGMWIFIGTEIMMFGAFFLVYAVYRFLHNKAFEEASTHLNMLYGSINTAVLLTSSLTMAFAVHKAKQQRTRAAVMFLALTALIGLGFLGLKSYEYYEHWHKGYYPSSDAPEWLKHTAPFRLFFDIYYTTTAIHFFHVLSGICVMISFIIYRPLAKTKQWARKIEATGLYWHFVDIVWIFLFPLLYLIGRSK